MEENTYKDHFKGLGREKYRGYNGGKGPTPNGKGSPNVSTYQPRTGGRQGGKGWICSHF